MSESTTREILEGLDYPELNALRRRAEWCDINWTPSHDELLEKMNSSVTGAVTHGNLTTSRLIEEIKEEVIYPGPNKIDTQIREILRETVITNSANGSSHPEELGCAHLTGVLQGQLGSRFNVVQEKLVGGNKELDIYLKDNLTGSEYLIEAKVENRFTVQKLEKQLQKYHSLLDSREKTYVVFLLFKDDYWDLYEKKHTSQLNSFLGEDTLDGIKSIDDEVEVILNLNPA